MAERREVLSREEVEAYGRDGVLVPEFRLPGDVLDRLRGLADKLVAENGHLGHQPMISPHVPGSGVQGLRSDPGWIEFPTYPPILDMMEQILGPDIVLWGTAVFSKPANKGGIVPWHRDGRYWPIRPLATASVWIAIDECTTENGCLRAIPGSHKAGEIGRHFRSEREDFVNPETLEEDEYDEREARDLELEPGRMALFDVFTIHGSNANPSGRRRAGYAMRYMPATSHYDHANIPVPDSPGAAHETRPLIQVRGVDRTGRNDFRIGHPEPA